MKTTAIASACLFAAGLAAAECVTVEQAPIYQPSPARVRITALLNGISIFSTAGPQRRISTSTDWRGVATTPKLLAGRYQVVANGEGDLVAQLYLHVSGAPRNRAKSFSMNLAPSHPVFPPEGAVMEAARKAPVTERIEEFAGQILDPLGAPIPGTEIQVLRKGSRGEVVAKLKSDETGRFAASLPIGTYIAFARAQAFRTETIVFERVPASGSKELRIVFHVGSC